jgi:hypothetical protein
LTNSTSINEKINSLLSQQTQNLESQKKKTDDLDLYFTKQKEIFDNLERVLNEKTKMLETQFLIFLKI